MSDLIGEDIIKGIRDLDPATDQVTRGVDHYVQDLGDKLDQSVLGYRPPSSKVAAAAPEVATELQTPAPMASLNSAEARASKRRSLAIQAARRGRLSTILTNDDALGG